MCSGRRYNIIENRARDGSDQLSLTSGGWVKIKVKLPHFPRIRHMSGFFFSLLAVGADGKQIHLIVHRAAFFVPSVVFYSRIDYE